MKKRADPALKRDIEQDISELDALIDDVLLASRLDAVTAPEAKEDVDLLGLAAEEGARYAATEVSGEAVIVRGDRRLLRRMVRNLLENARRHGAPPVTVRIRRVADQAELRVCDHGPGIPAGEREAVFRPFHRFAGSAETTGAGLGLALVAQIAARHGGQARYAGGDGGESCFVVTLPAAG
jgi:signal transduction histidine kinase